MKELVAKELSTRVKDGDVLGLGSGSTVELALKQIGERIRKEGVRVSGVPTSHKVALLAESCGITVLAPVSRVELSWTFDGADEVDGELNLIKGAGAAMFNEKIVARRSKRVVIIVGEDKLVKQLGTHFPVPVEVVPEALGYVEGSLKKLGATGCKLRTVGEKERLVVTEHNNLIFDVTFKEIVPMLDGAIKCLTGVVEHGLFFGIADEVLVAKKDGVWALSRGAQGVGERKIS